MGQERSPAFLHLLSAGRPARYGTCGIGSGQFPGSHFHQLPGTGHAGGGKYLVSRNPGLTTGQDPTPGSASLDEIGAG
jgi:hypothetical protein